jgi:PAS domain S-box-containing protein
MPNSRNTSPLGTAKARELESYFRDLFEAAPDAMVVVDQTSRIVLVNAQTERLFGYQREEIHGQYVEVLIPHRFRERHQAHRITFFSEPRVRPMGASLQLFGLCKDGTEFPVEISLSPIETPHGVLVTSAIRDISERKAAEGIRLELAAIVESSEDAIISKNLDAVITSWNSAAQRIFGYTEEEAIGQPIAILVPPELQDEENMILEKLRAGERIEHYETIRVTKTGQRVNISLCISPIKDLTGKIVGFSKIARHITERKRAEEMLRASEERLRLALEAAHIGTFEWNIRTGVNTWTPALEAIYGLHPGEFGRTQTAFENLVHPDDRARVIELVEGTLKTGQSTRGEWRVVWPDGSIHWIAGRWQVFRDESGEPSRMIGVNGDITERKLAEEALRESEQRLRLAMQVARMYAYDWDLKSDLVERSSEHVNILGLTEPLRLPQNQFVDKIHADDRPKFLAAIAGLTPEIPTGEVTYRARASDGTLVWLKSNGRGFFDADGKMLRVVGMVADITDFKRAEEALTGFTKKLIEAQEQERARIGRELHDDINQQLALLGVELEQLQGNPSEVPSRLQDLRQRLAEVSNDVQALSHELHSSKLEYLGVIAGMRSWCREIAARHKIEIDFNSNVSRVLPLDLGRSLFRVLQEALNNAIKYSGVRRVEVQVWERSSEVDLVIRDSGRGFSLDEALQGPGLGLTSMRERVRLVNGTIAIDSKPMGGTTVHVRVPFGLEHRSQVVAG